MPVEDPSHVLRQIARALECDRTGCVCHATARKGFGPTHCPSHDDHTPSLNLTAKNGLPLWHCHAGCTQEAVLAELRAKNLLPGGWRPVVLKNPTTGLTLVHLAEAKGLDLHWLQEELGWEDGLWQGRPAVRIPYRDNEDKTIAIRWRVALEGDRFRWEKGVQASELLYGLDHIHLARAQGWVLVVEGESDCAACWQAGIPAVGVPGQGLFGPAQAQHLAGIPCWVVWSEPDARLAELVVQHRAQARVATIEAAGCGFKDPCEAARALGEGFGEWLRRLVEAASAQATVSSADPEPDLQPTWPAPIDEAAFWGLAGEVVRRIEPTSEADPIALLLTFLAYFGAAAGLGPYVRVEDTHHGPNEYFGLIGATSKARKGTAERRIRRFFEAVDPDFRARIRRGLSSGEGVIWAVRDPTVNGKGEEVDPGVSDKRLLVVESELATALRRIERDGSSLSPVLRDAWDRVPLNTLVSERHKAAVGAQRSHIGLLGQITRAELTRYLSRTEMANGFGNRFLWALVRRSKYLPRGGPAPTMADLVAKTRKALEHAWACEEIDLDQDANQIWTTVYPSLSDPKPGLAGDLLARAEAHVLRLALIYALLDRARAIGPEHLRAALAVWTYCEDSVRCVFAEELGDPDADAVLGQLREHPEGSTTKELHEAFGRHWSAERLRRALGNLIEHGAVITERVASKGRPATVYRLVSRPKEGPQPYLDLVRTFFALSSHAPRGDFEYENRLSSLSSLSSLAARENGSREGGGGADCELSELSELSPLSNTAGGVSPLRTKCELSPEPAASGPAPAQPLCNGCGSPAYPALPDGWWCRRCLRRWGQSRPEPEAVVQVPTSPQDEPDPTSGSTSKVEASMPPACKRCWRTTWATGQPEAPWRCPVCGARFGEDGRLLGG